MNHIGEKNSFEFNTLSLKIFWEKNKKKNSEIMLGFQDKCLKEWLLLLFSCFDWQTNMIWQEPYLEEKMTQNEQLTSALEK